MALPGSRETKVNAIQPVTCRNREERKETGAGGLSSSVRELVIEAPGVSQCCFPHLPIAVFKERSKVQVL